MDHQLVCFLRADQTCLQVLGAWGLGWEIWMDGMEITQFTYFQQVTPLKLNRKSSLILDYMAFMSTVIITISLVKLLLIFHDFAKFYLVSLEAFFPFSLSRLEACNCHPYLLKSLMVLSVSSCYYRSVFDCFFY